MKVLWQVPSNRMFSVQQDRFQQAAGQPVFSAKRDQYQATNLSVTTLTERLKSIPTGAGFPQGKRLKACRDDFIQLIRSATYPLEILLLVESAQRVFNMKNLAERQMVYQFLQKGIPLDRGSAVFEIVRQLKELEPSVDADFMALFMRQVEDEKLTSPQFARLLNISKNAIQPFSKMLASDWHEVERSNKVLMDAIIRHAANLKVSKDKKLTLQQSVETVYHYLDLLAPKVGIVQAISILDHLLRAKPSFAIVETYVKAADRLFSDTTLSKPVKDAYTWLFSNVADLKFLSKANLKEIRHELEALGKETKAQQLLLQALKEHANPKELSRIKRFLERLQQKTELTEALSEILAPFFKNNGEVTLLPVEEDDRLIETIWGKGSAVLKPILTTLLQHDKLAHWQKLLGASRILHQLEKEQFTAEELQAVLTVLRKHDELFLKVYAQDVQSIGTAVDFFKRHRLDSGEPISSAVRAVWYKVNAEIDFELPTYLQQSVREIAESLPKREELLPALKFLMHEESVLRDILGDVGIISSPQENQEIQVLDPDRLKTQLALFLNTADPNRFLNFVLHNQENLEIPVLRKFFANLEYYTDLTFLRSFFPEVSALIPTFLRRARQADERKVQASTREETEEKVFLEMLSLGITHVWEFLSKGKVNTTQGIFLNNLARIGTVGLRFKSWQYDAMTPWKGQGARQQKPLLAASGLFKAIPPRPDDPKYFGGFLHQESGLTIELRRAYIVISQQDLGTLVIRNNSPLFGRDKLPGMAYFSATKTYLDPTQRFDPGTIWEEHQKSGSRAAQEKRFMPVTSLAMNIDKEKQMQYQGAVSKLLDTFDAVMQRYVYWKCTFLDGIPSEGLHPLLSLAYHNAAVKAMDKPFPSKGGSTGLKLAWVKQQDLPAVIQTYDPTTSVHQKELAYYISMIDRRRVPQGIQQVDASKMQDLYQFLSFGLTHNLDLVLRD